MITMSINKEQNDACAVPGGRHYSMRIFQCFAFSQFACFTIVFHVLCVWRDGIQAPYVLHRNDNP